MYYATRRIGNGYAGLKRFLQLVNHPPPMTKNNYGKITTAVHQAVKEVTHTIMQEASAEIRGSSADIAVSNDRTWQKRGFTFNGAVVTISIPTGKILDCEVMSRFCQGCVYIDKFRNTDPELYEKYMNEHSDMNHDGSAPKMEMVGVEKIFRRSIEKNKLRYTEYFGDGDTKSFSAVESVYGDIPVAKKRVCWTHSKTGWM